MTPEITWRWMVAIAYLLVTVVVVALLQMRAEVGPAPLAPVIAHDAPPFSECRGITELQRLLVCYMEVQDD